MKVIGAGLPRTATTTQADALEMLGFAHCYHMADLLADLENGLTLWEAVADGDPDWETIFGDAQSSCNWPSARYYKELADYYPDAKVILTVRDAVKWVKSMRETVWAMYFGDSVLHRVCDGRRALDPLWRRFMALMTVMIWDEHALGPPHASYNDASLMAAMHRWNDQVKRDIPPDRLLVWEPRDGWAPLCKFLEVPVPAESLPKTNERASFREGILSSTLAFIDEWWDQRPRPAARLHGGAGYPKALTRP